MNYLKTLLACITLTCFSSIMISHIVSDTTTPIKLSDGSLLTVHAGMVKAADGNTYRVEMTEITGQENATWRVVEAFIVDKPEFSIVGTTDHPNTWIRQEFCTIYNHVSECDDIADVTPLLDEFVKKVNLKKNGISDWEIYWSWLMESKRLRQPVL